MKYFHIRKLTGIETNMESVKQDRGTLRRANGVIVTPLGGASTGPIWRSAWAQATLGTAIEAALAGADGAKVHFVTVAAAGATLLIAWDMAAHRPRFAWQVGGGTPDFSAAPAVVVTAPATAIYRNKTAARTWSGNPVDSRLIIGNGADANLVWQNGALALFGPSAAVGNAANPGKEAFPPCSSFCQDIRGVIYGAGNTTYPLRVWQSDRPTTAFPRVDGVRALATSYRDVLADAGASVTALRMANDLQVAVHLSQGGTVIIRPSADNGIDGITRPPANHAGAINPNCVRDVRTSPFYLGADLEVYKVRRIAQPDNSNDWRDMSLATDKSAGDWNAALAKPAAGDYATIFDKNGGRLWIFATLNAATGARQALYCYNMQNQAITGPWFYPDLLAVTLAGDGNQPGMIAVGISRDGALLYADLSDVGERPLPNPSDALGADYAELGAPPAATPGLPYVGVSADGLQFKQVLNGQILSMASPWDDFAVADIAATRFYKNAHLVVMELSLEDFGESASAKDVMEVIIRTLRNQRVYAGVYVEANGDTDAKWLGTDYPEPQLTFPVMVNGHSLRLRIIAVCFNDSPALFSGVSLGLLSVGIPK